MVASARLHDRMGRRVLAGVSLIVVVVGAVVVVLLSRGGGDHAPSAADVAATFTTRWSAGHDGGAAVQTDVPVAALRALRADRAGLDGARVHAVPGPTTVHGERATTPLAVTWTIPRIGRWAVRTTLRLRRATDGTWRVHFTPAVAGPHLTPGTRLGTEATRLPRAAILDRDGRALVRARPVVEVGLQRDRVHDVTASARALAAAVDVDEGALARRLRGAGPREFVLAITLRAADYARVAARVRAVPGVATVDATAPLTPSRTFARALLGAVGPATADQVQASGGRLADGDQTGQWGLEQQFDARLLSKVQRRIVVRDADGAVVRVVHTVPGSAGRPLRTTLSRRAQDAAEAALGATSKNEALVVVQPSTGDVLAVANRPTSSTFDRALTGAYAPGSTFKIVTADALLGAGILPSTPVPCPPTTTVDGRSFRNFEGEASGSPDFAQDFAISCNTAFIGLAGRLGGASTLTTVAKRFGLGVAVHGGVPMAASHVPPATSATGRAAMMIGQDRITASPVAVAGVAATVADGRWHAPRLLADDPHVSGPPLGDDERNTLATLMRGVVERGTASALAGVAGEPAGKTGTAEYGTGDPPPTHGWFVAYRGDLALAVLVEHGVSGATAAVPIAARFFAAYGD
jgi:cell division protein FtsI/penicillin-binding protein 2